MKKDKAHKLSDNIPGLASEPEWKYDPKKIYFSSVENQSDIQLRYALSITPTERLLIMQKLNEHAFRHIPKKKMLYKGAPIIFSSYEYIP